MSKVLMSLLFSAFILTGLSFAQTPPPAAPAAAPAAPVAAPAAPMHHHDHYPELHRALHKLRGAKQDLEKAAHDYDGHKVAAIEAINHAIVEIQAALDYAHAHQ